LNTALRACILDLDGTLVDTLGDFVVALNAALQDHRLPAVDADGVMRCIGKGSAHLVQAVLTQLGVTSTPADAVLASYLRHYAGINGAHASLYPGVTEGLQILRTDLGWPLVCVTNKPHTMAVDLLARKGLLPHFEQVFGGDSFARRKPDPLPLIEACKALGVEPAHTLMVGDSSNDAQAARAAGCPVVLVDYGYNHGQPVHALLEQGLIDGVVARLDDPRLVIH
jgi:phosphoglycolate phosphatase